MKSSLVPVCCPEFSQPHGRVSRPSGVTLLMRRRGSFQEELGQFTPLQQSRVSPWHAGVRKHGATALFKGQVMIFLASPAICADCHGREQNNPLSSTSAGASVTTNPSQPARSLCQSHKDLSHSAQLLSKDLFSLASAPG